jgi:hypothetical protein
MFLQVHIKGSGFSNPWAGNTPGRHGKPGT